jgi:hypothetical protein
MRRLQLLALATLLGACAPRIALVPHPDDPVPLAREPVGEGLAEVVWARAVRLLTARGYQFDACDDGLSALRTARVEVEAPCGATTCLARQYVTIKVGWRAVRLAVRREVWDASWRDWVPLTDPRSQADVIRLERELLGELMSQANRWAGRPPWSVGQPRCPQPWPCEPGQCDLIGLASSQGPGH